jgi:hypothetical protein
MIDDDDDDSDDDADDDDDDDVDDSMMTLVDIMLSDGSGCSEFPNAIGHHVE